MISKAFLPAFLSGLLLLVSCGKDDPPKGKLPDESLRSEFTAKAAATLDSATTHLLSLLSEPPPNAAAELNQFSVQFKNLTSGAAEIGANPSTSKIQRDLWDPALGKFHAATRATLENPDAAPESIAAIRSLAADVAALDRALQ